MNLTGSQILYAVLLTALLTYLLRAVPLLLLRKKLTNPFLIALFKYMPFALLSAMIFPDIFNSTADITTEAADAATKNNTQIPLISAIMGFAIALFLSLKDKKLPVVAAAACGVALIVERICTLFIF